MDASESSTALKSGKEELAEVVEIGLLLPQTWAQALMELSLRRNQSVAQVLRSMIGHELRDCLMSP